MPAPKARPSIASLAKQIESLTRKTRRAERGFAYEMRKFKGMLRSEVHLARSEAARQARGLRMVLAKAARKLIPCVPQGFDG